MKKNNRFPPGWNEKRVREVLEHCEALREEEVVAEDEAAYESELLRTFRSFIDR
jgi:hypothetical protein